MRQLTRTLPRTSWKSPRAYASIRQINPFKTLLPMLIAFAIALLLSQISHASERLPGIIGLDVVDSATDGAHLLRFRNKTCE